MFPLLSVFDAFSVCRCFYQKPAVGFSEGLSEQQEQITTHHRSVEKNTYFVYVVYPVGL